MDLQDIINILRPIPSEFHHNDHVTRAVAVAVKRIIELEHADEVAPEEEEEGDQ